MKAVLVIDMPDNVSLDEWFAKVIVDRLKVPEEEMMSGVAFDESKTFNFVPLKPMPQMKNTEIVIKGHTGEIARAYQEGWNACIDAITGETE